MSPTNFGGKYSVFKLVSLILISLFLPQLLLLFSSSAPPSPCIPSSFLFLVFFGLSCLSPHLLHTFSNNYPHRFLVSSCYHYLSHWDLYLPLQLSHGKLLHVPTCGCSSSCSPGCGYCFSFFTIRMLNFRIVFSSLSSCYISITVRVTVLTLKQWIR
jgi:hypothetical protein